LKEHFNVLFLKKKKFTENDKRKVDTNNEGITENEWDRGAVQLLPRIHA
jgi:hypothetical protein